MRDYYSDKLSAQKLKRCYDIATPRIRQYLEAEIAFVREQIKATDTVLEMGCGYGRVLLPLMNQPRRVVGIDTSLESLRMARASIDDADHIGLFQMNAAATGFRDNSFDLVVCIQNGISAFKVDCRKLIEEAMRITRPGGMALFSSYAERFWPDRLRWFELQAEHGLLGGIDYNATGDGVIICKDGFRADTIGPDDFIDMTFGLDSLPILEEVDGSSLFCVLHK